MAYNPSRRAVTGYVSALGLALGAPNASASLADAELLALGVRYDAARKTVIEAGKAGDYPDDFHFVDIALPPMASLHHVLRGGLLRPARRMLAIASAMVEGRRQIARLGDKLNRGFCVGAGRADFAWAREGRAAPIGM
jgi:hypothetical protein